MMLTQHDEKKSTQGPYTPLVILHGGAGSITRAGLPPELYQQYHDSLKSYLESTQALLEGHTCMDTVSSTSRPKAANAVDAAVHAVSLFEDDPLFNCGHGAVFTTNGEVQMEASLAVSSIHDSIPSYLPGHIKKSAAVSMVTRTRHPIQLAKLVLEMADAKDAASVRDMHGHLSGKWIEELGFQYGLERKPRRWFWTRKRWDEHRRGLALNHSDEEWKRKLDEDDEDRDHGQSNTALSRDQSQQLQISTQSDQSINTLLRPLSHYHDLPSQGTVGAVCMDSWGNLAVATSTGGLTNKRPGRIGDTPTIGAGFWAESWKEDVTPTTTIRNVMKQYFYEGYNHQNLSFESLSKISTTLAKGSISWLQNCLLPSAPGASPPSTSYHPIPSHDYNYDHKQHNRSLLTSNPPPYTSPSTSTSSLSNTPTPSNDVQTRAIALSGTGNGDSFLRTCLARTTGSLLHYDATTSTLQDAVTLAAGPHGILQKSAESRWNTPGGAGEGEGGMIGIEATLTRSPSQECERGSGEVEANVVFDFNCGGMWRAYFVDDEGGGKKRVPKVMVFRDEYY